MNKIIKKSTVIFLCLSFLMLAVTYSFGANINKIISDVNEVIKETEISRETVVIYRCGPDGSIIPIGVNLELKEGQNIGDALISKCDQLLKNDKEINDLLDQPNNTFGFIVRIQSMGKGFHYKTRVIEKMYLRYLLWKFTLPRISTLLARPLIYCRYAKDLTAKTIIKPLLGKNQSEITLQGAHSVLVNNFIGYTTWLGRFAYAPFTIIPRAFSGYARFAIINKL